MGLTTALAGVGAGLRVALIDRAPLDRVVADGRASSLAPTSLQMFENLGVEIADHVQPLRDMLVTEGQPDSPWRLHFEGDGDGGDLGGLVENAHLRAALLKAIAAQTELTLFAPVEAQVSARDASGVQIDVGGQEITAALLVAADGRDSALRRASGINVNATSYNAASLVAIVEHDAPHDGLAWQGFAQTGPLALLPLTEQRSQVVWSGPTAAIEAAVALPEADFLGLLRERSGDYLGAMRLSTSRASWPLRLQIAETFVAERLALVGDAAHVIHPLAGQGLNLGLRDVASLIEGVMDARAAGQDIGVAGLLEYDAARRPDVKLMGAATHGLFNLYQVKSTAIGHLRRAGLFLTNRTTALKSAMRLEAAGQTGTLPRLMQPGFQTDI